MSLVITEGPSRERYLSVTVGHHMNVVANIDVAAIYFDVPWLHQHRAAAKGFKMWRDKVAYMPLFEKPN